MKRIDVEETELTVRDLAKLVKAGTVILTRKGKPLAALKLLTGDDWDSISLANNPKFQALIEESRRSCREEGGISLDALRRDLGLAKNGMKAKPKRSKR